MPMAPRPNSMGLPASSNITSYWSNRRACDPPSASSALPAANPDTEPDSSVAADSAPKAPRRMQTGQNSLSAVAKNFVPQTGHVHGSCGTDPRFLPGSSTGSPDSGFTASAVLRRRLEQYCLGSFQFLLVLKEMDDHIVYAREDGNGCGGPDHCPSPIADHLWSL